MIKLLHKFDYPNLDVRVGENDSGRFYSSKIVDLGQDELPSVTTILSATDSPHKKEGLKRWREKIGDERADTIVREASIRGSHLHDYLECKLLDRDVSHIPDLPAHMAEVIYKQGLQQKLTMLYGTEQNIYVPKGYAGTIDCIGMYEGLPTVIDFKQSNKPKRAEWIGNYWLQLCAYITAHNKLFEDENRYSTKIMQGVILLCTVDLQFQRFVLRIDEAVFNDLLVQLRARWRKYVQKN